nr:MAG TPA: hypothetical protein [Caudoviricetes sp.]
MLFFTMSRICVLILLQFKFLRKRVSDRFFMVAYRWLFFL